MSNNIDELLYYDDRVFKYLEDEPCTHPGCKSHITHPCEGCGKQWGTTEDTDDNNKEEVFDCDSWIKWVTEYKEVKERERILIHEAIETGLITDVKHLISRYNQMVNKS